MTTQPRLASGFSLIESFLILATAIILLATVDTWLSDYRVRSHVSDAFQAAEAAKSHIVMTCAADSSLDEISNTAIPLDLPYSKYVQSVTISGSCDQPLIALQTTNTGLIVEPMMVISGHSSGDKISWSCSGTGMQNDMPARCSGI